MIEYGCPSWDNLVFQRFLRSSGYTPDEAGEHKLREYLGRLQEPAGARAPIDPKYDPEENRDLDYPL